jgi:TRAP-type uncharacterized transport system substrate-binding protein
MATGAAGGGYSEFGERYREILARQGVRLGVHGISGSVENLALLRSPGSGVSIALVQNGITDPQQSPEVVSLGTVGLVPLWIFYRGPEAPREALDRLRGLHVSVGPMASGTRKLALDLLALSGVDELNTKLLLLAPSETADRLIARDIEAALILARPDAPAVRRLLAAPDIRLLSLRRAEAYIAHDPFLTHLALPAGYADLTEDRPPANVSMLAIKMSLIVRRDLTSVVQYLLLDAATQISARSSVGTSSTQRTASPTPSLTTGLPTFCWRIRGPRSRRLSVISCDVSTGGGDMTPVRIMVEPKLAD